VADTPFRCEDWHTKRESSGHAILDRLVMSGGSCVEVHSIRNVAARHWILSCLVNVLRPLCAAEDRNVLCILPDLRHNLGMVGLERCRPAYPWCRLIESLEEHIWECSVLFGHLCKEGLGLWDMMLSMMVVPINDDINAGFDSGIHNCHNFGLLDDGVFEVPTPPHSHGCSKHTDPPVAAKPMHCGTVPILPHPL